jgi:hypothetical protein
VEVVPTAEGLDLAAGDPRESAAANPVRRAELGRVGMWRGGNRLNISVAAPFVWRCLSGSAVTPFPHPAHR